MTARGSARAGFCEGITMKDPFHFLNVPRMDPPVLTAELRVRRFAEIHAPFKADDAAAQSGRCLACGNPYCEWKCPVHNYIPDWLKLAAGRAGSCLRRLNSPTGTNSLPEICGRICPQDRLCEGACTLNDGYGRRYHRRRGTLHLPTPPSQRGWRPDLGPVSRRRAMARSHRWRRAGRAELRRRPGSQWRGGDRPIRPATPRLADC